MRTRALPFIVGLLLCIGGARSQPLYFPPLVGNTWETTDPASLGWCADRIDSLYAYLEAHHTKGFIVLKDGRIVLERYFGTFTQDSLWYWASAGKTLTSLLTGIAQEEGFLDIDLPTSTYLGTGWSNEPPDKEALITVRHQLTMTSGLDDGVPDNHCTLDTCLQYLADAGTRWAYHNAPYTLLDPVITAATGQNFSTYFNARIRNPIGMGGLWVTSDYDHVYVSKVRGMARYGLLALNGFIWNGDTLIHDTAYVQAMTHPSQALNASYGYLWWLNEGESFMLPGLQFVFPGHIVPHAPPDMFNGLGKNDQLLNVVPSENLVLVRMGEPANEGLEVSVTFDDGIWQYMNALTCTTDVHEEAPADGIAISPNPCADRIRIQLPRGEEPGRMDVTDAMGRMTTLFAGPSGYDVSRLAPGPYGVILRSADRVLHGRFLKE